MIDQTLRVLAEQARGDLGARLLLGGDDPYPLYDEIRDRGPLVRSELGFHLTASHPVADRLLRHPAAGVRVRPERAAPDGVVDPLTESFGALDGREHSRLRRPAALGLRMADITGRAVDIETRAVELLDRLRPGRPFDLVADYAALLPMLVMSDLLGLDRPDTQALRRWSAAEVAVLGGQGTADDVRRWHRALREAETMFRAALRARREQPRDDLLGRLVATDPPLTERELVATAEMVFFAGYDTTPWLIANTVLALLRHPDRETCLAAPCLVEESLRYDPPVQFTARTARRRIELDGGAVPAGDTVIVVLAGANRDPAVFHTPNIFDPYRPNVRAHLTFAPGPHHCLGAGLAVLEAGIAVRVLFDRLPGLRRTGPITRRPLVGLRAVESLPVTG